MGQAKQRGTFEQRKTAAKARQIDEQLRKREEHAAREAAMTPQERAERATGQRKLNMLLAAALAASASLSVR